MLSPNTILRERYRIIHQLGKGGMGAVYQAMDENLSCVVAVKETFATTDEQRRAFRREAQLLANLSHPALPKVMDHFTDGEGQFLVMQFVPGHDLAKLLKLREQPFAVAKVIEWADQLLDALEELHSFDPPIIHRDIKPKNLKLTAKDKVLLLDFGLAKGFAGQMSTADDDSQVKSVYGYTPNYAPLEQIRGAGTDARSDLYSLAATLWTLLTGKVPSDALSRVAEKDDGNPDPLRPAHEINPQVPAAVSSALNRALAVNRNHRQPSAAEFRKALREAADSVAGDGGRGKLNRRIALIGAGALVVAISIGILAWTGWRPWAAQQAKPTNASTANLSLPNTRTNQAGIEFVLIPSGSFMMGSTNGEGHEKPVHQVTINYSFYMGKYEVTQAQWQSVMGSTPSNFKGDNLPVEMVSWDEAIAFIARLNAQNDGFTYRLPTEAEWEYVCRARTTGDYAGDLDAMAWYGNNSGRGQVDAAEIDRTDFANYAERITENGGQTHAVGTKLPNAFGLFDMYGNVWEWCQDWYHNSYNGAPGDGSAWLSGGEQEYRVRRGGSWYVFASGLRSAFRYYSTPDVRSSGTGFRVVAVR